jgi:hypothetical protein
MVKKARIGKKGKNWDVYKILGILRGFSQCTRYPGLHVNETIFILRGKSCEREERERK